MRKVLKSYNEVAHFWANKVQSEARYSAMYFEGDSIFSYGYHFCIARHVTNKKGNPAILFSTRTYSSTTTSHQRCVRSAIAENIPVFEVYNAGYDVFSGIDFHIEEIKSQVEKLFKARKPEIYLGNIIEHQNEAKRIIAFFPEVKVPKAYLAVINSDVRNSDFSGLNNLIRAKIKFDNKAIEKRKKEIVEKAKADAKSYLLKFRSGKSNSYYNPIDRDLALLRLDNDALITSKGIRIPLPVAKRFYKWITTAWKTGESLVGHKILEFEIAEFTPEYFRAGCHKITKKEVLRLRTALD